MRAYSIGVIGGADGPTSVFIAGPNWSRPVIGIVILAALVVGIILLRKSKR